MMNLIDWVCTLNAVDKGPDLEYGYKWFQIISAHYRVIYLGLSFAMVTSNSLFVHIDCTIQHVHCTIIQHVHRTIQKYIVQYNMYIVQYNMNIVQYNMYIVHVACTMFSVLHDVLCTLLVQLFCTVASHIQINRSNKEVIYMPIGDCIGLHWIWYCSLRFLNVRLYQK